MRPTTPTGTAGDAYDGNPDDELPIFTSAALDERYYGKLQGLNKAETAEKYGADQVLEWRRSYSTRPPGGESLEDTKLRVEPFFSSRIMAHIRHGDNVLVAAHGNSLRSIIMVLDNLSEADVPALELDTGVPIIYDFNLDGKAQKKTVLLK
jgi:2,3-bisphosphoglycerate-dependent phosphoglycerate mutase